jgi:hypothetical protein
MRKPYIIGIIIREKTGLPPALAKLNVKEFRYPYHNFRGININDNGLKSSIFFKGYVLLRKLCVSCMNRKYAGHAVHLPSCIQYAAPEITTFFTWLRVSKTAFRERLQHKVFPRQDHLDAAAPFLDPVAALEKGRTTGLQQG